MDKKGDVVNSSSMIDLKAVLFTTANAAKRARATGVRDQPPNKKKALWEKRNSGVDKRNAKDATAPVISMEEEDMLAKSKAVLQQKAALYEKLSKGKNVPVNQQDDEEKGFLVDFEKKAYDTSTVMATKKKKKEKKASVDSENDWVDHVDSLGRSRRCLRKDLPQLKEMDADLSGKGPEEEQDTEKPASSFLPWLKQDATLVSEDMYKEMRRQKWEEQEQELAERDGPVHFEDIRFNEAREMGVGYYQFSTDQAERRKQMDHLKSLRNQTIEERQLHQLQKDRRKTALEVRLRKVKARYAKQLGVEPDEEGEIDTAEESTQGTAEGKSSELAAEELAAKTAEEIATSRRLEEERRAAATVEWERGMGDLSATKATNTQDDDRDEEFAPPSIYTPARSKPKNPAIIPGRSLGDLSVKVKGAGSFSTVLKQRAKAQSDSGDCSPSMTATDVSRAATACAGSANSTKDQPVAAGQRDSPPPVPGNSAFTTSQSDVRSVSQPLFNEGSGRGESVPQPAPRAAIPSPPGAVQASWNGHPQPMPYPAPSYPPAPGSWHPGQYPHHYQQPAPPPVPYPGNTPHHPPGNAFYHPPGNTPHHPSGNASYHPPGNTPHHPPGNASYHPPGSTNFNNPHPGHAPPSVPGAPPPPGWSAPGQFVPGGTPHRSWPQQLPGPLPHPSALRAARPPQPGNAPAPAAEASREHAIQSAVDQFLSECR